MKKIILICMIAVCALLSGCTGNQRARTYGGEYRIELEPGEKLIEATWKEDNIWYLTEPMEEGYQPKTKMFRENSNLGCLEGTVVFVESRK